MELFNFWLSPLIIFTARVLDVSLGTLRIVAVSRGMKKLAPFLGFFEILIWISAMALVMNNLSNAVNYVAYAGGFATGNYIGLLIEQRLSIGNRIVRIITGKHAVAMRESLKEEGFGATTTDAIGEFGPVSILFTVVKRKEIPQVLAIIQKHNPQAFYTIEDVSFVHENRLNYRKGGRVKRIPFFDLLTVRKSK